MTTSSRRLALLSVLYVVEGLPFGFQATALGVLLRDRGVSLSGLGLAGLLSTPWALKALWAPLVDRHGSARFGRRRSWIVPMQLLLALALFGVATLDPEGQLVPLLLAVLAMNFVAATMDIAVDGLAVEILGEHELGLGNAAQVVGYKIGMLLGGGVLLWASTFLSWGTLFSAMAGIVIFAMAITLLVPEPASEAAHEEKVRTSARAILGTLRNALRAPGTAALLLAIVGYKMGESLIEPMWTPFLRDHGFSRATIGLYVGTFGMVASILGSLSGGVIATRISLPRALALASAFRVVALAGQAAVAFQDAPSHVLVAISTCGEHFFSGVLVTVMFALMMSRTDRRIGATHYTLLATIEVLGKAPFSLASGFVADAIGVRGAFSLAVGLSLGYLLALASPPIRRGLTAPDGSGSAATASDRAPTASS